MTPKTVVADVALLGKMAGYIEILVKDPHSTVFAPLSDIYRTFGLLDEAIDVARKGTELVPFYAQGFISLGRALAESGDLAGAQAAYEGALALEAEHLPALTGLASLHLGRGDAALALSLLDKAQQISPEDEVVLRMLPIAQKLADKSHASSPPQPQPQSLAAVVTPLPHVVADDVQEVACSSAEAPPSMVAHPPISTATLADIYIRQGFPEKALKVYADLLSTDPGNVEIRTRHDVLQKEISGSLDASSVILEPSPSPAALSSAEAGVEGLIALYSRWLDAVKRRRAHV